MKMITMLILFFVMGLCITAKAQWVNFPAGNGNTNGFEWEQIRTNWIQLLLAANERSKATESAIYLQGFEVTGTYRVPAGISNNVGAYVAYGFPSSFSNNSTPDINYVFGQKTNIGSAERYENAFGWELRSNQMRNAGKYFWYYTNSDNTFSSTNWFSIIYGDRVVGARTWITNTFTNVYQLSTNIVMTNLNLTPYTYTDETGTHTATGFPYVTQAQQAALDDRISALIPFYVATNQATNGNFNSWFESSTNFPMWTKSNLFLHLGVGIVTNGNAYFTRYPSMTNTWLLYEVSYTGIWAQNNIGTNALRYYESIPPVARYTTGGSNAMSSYSFVLSGKVLTTIDQSLSNDSETISVTSSNTELTKLWHSITNISCATAGANTGDVLAVMYTNAHPVYGDAPYEIFSADLDERWKVLDALRWTVKEDLVFAGTPDDTNSANNDITSWAGAKADAETFSLQLFPVGHVGQLNWAHYTTNASPDPDVYTARIEWGSNAVAFVSLFTNLSPQLYAYCKAITNTYFVNTNVQENIFDLQGDALTYSTNFFEYTNSLSAEAGATNYLWIGRLSQPSTFNWPTEPTLDRYTYKGYQLTVPKMLLKWDEGTTNKFIFK